MNDWSGDMVVDQNAPPNTVYLIDTERLLVLELHPTRLERALEWLRGRRWWPWRRGGYHAVITGIGPRDDG